MWKSGHANSCSIIYNSLSSSSITNTVGSQLSSHLSCFPYFLSEAQYCSSLLYLAMYFRRSGSVPSRGWVQIRLSQSCGCIPLASEWFRVGHVMWFWPLRHENKSEGVRGGASGRLLKEGFPSWLKRHTSSQKTNKPLYLIDHLVIRGRASLRINHHTKNGRAEKWKEPRSLMTELSHWIQPS